ncbi:hypothetical protein [Flavobacterium reichenbachii]|uniref:Uncharacterized protein n=1 Tax=Flavobacterium reichenbachii TaxID=362418 RepID=A0A085ZRN5_9FLAO|nr:hypothetical protein [Flavobacterium reichenbachii]KFF07099.1 hypothetical protein IW19_16960 [Flavobacterium reichenbachii]OXB13406.1 hypothetical protein B0A68_16795 [Flavobacterium reichenbachii]
MLESINKNRNLISALVNHHFCIENVTKSSVLEVLKVSNTEVLEFDEKFDWSFLSDENSNNTTKPFLLFTEINEWSYLIWNVWDFEETKQMALFLSKELNTKVYYFFVDPWIATCRWVLADKGNLLASYYESHGKILNNDGNSEIGNILKKEDYFEDKFWNLYNSICQSIEILNKQQNVILTKGYLSR